MTKAKSTRGTTLAVKKSGSTFTAFAEVVSVPEIGQTSDKIDATNLTSEMKEYIPDIPDYASDLEFTLSAIAQGETDSNLDLLEELDPDTIYTFKVTYSQLGKEVTFPAMCRWRMGAAEVSAKQDVIVTLVPTGPATFANSAMMASLSYNTNAGGA